MPDSAESVRPCYEVSTIKRYRSRCRICDWVSREYGVFDMAEERAQEHQATHIDGLVAGED